MGLTPREIEVVRLLARGLHIREIADALSLSEYTARSHTDCPWSRSESGLACRYSE